jgi:hypothetical protein
LPRLSTTLALGPAASAICGSTGEQHARVSARVSVA